MAIRTSVQQHLWKTPDRCQSLVYNPLVFLIILWLPVNAPDTEGQRRLSHCALERDYPDGGLHSEAQLSALLSPVWAKAFMWRCQMALAGSSHTDLCQVGLTYPESPVQSRWLHLIRCAIPPSWEVAQSWPQCDTEECSPLSPIRARGPGSADYCVLWSLQLQKEAKTVTS